MRKPRRLFRHHPSNGEAATGGDFVPANAAARSRRHWVRIVRIISGLAALCLGCFISPTAMAQEVGVEPRSAAAATIAGAGISRYPDIVYAEIPGVDPSRLSLDVYAPPGLKDAPVVLFVHGGSWQKGDKLAALFKPVAFAKAGFVTVSTNYRFRPHVSLADMAGDVAKATAWVRDNIGRYGGDPDRIVLMGHSAGAHLVAVVGTNSRFLIENGVPASAIVGVVPLDTGPYDVELAMEKRQPQSRNGQMMELVFGLDQARWAEVSPVAHIRRELPPFLVRAFSETEVNPRVIFSFLKGTRAITSARAFSEGRRKDSGCFIRQQAQHRRRCSRVV